MALSRNQVVLCFTVVALSFVFLLPGTAFALGWLIETVDSDGSVGGSISLALDSNGYPAISYWDNTNLDLKFARWNGSSWDIEIVDSDGDVGRKSSLALDSNGYPAIGYRDLTNRDLKFARYGELPVDLNIKSVTVIRDECPTGGPGHLDGEAEPGEHVTIRMELINDGAEDATGVTGTLFSPDVTVTQSAGSLSLPLAPGLFADLAPDFEFDVPLAVSCGDSLNFSLRLAHNGSMVETESFTLAVPEPCDVCVPEPPVDIDIRSVTISADACSPGAPGHQDNEAEPGEHVTVRVKLINNGGSFAGGLTGVLSSPDVTVTQGAGSVAFTLGSGQSGDLAPDFEFDVPLTVLCGEALNFTLDLTYNGTQSETETFTIDVPDPCDICLPATVYRGCVDTRAVSDWRTISLPLTEGNDDETPPYPMGTPIPGEAYDDNLPCQIGSSDLRLYRVLLGGTVYAGNIVRVEKVPSGIKLSF
jgi:hypothetical protein